MVLLLMNSVAKTIGGYLPKSLQWSSSPQKINATLWRKAKEKKERGWALLHLRDLVTHSFSSSLTPPNRGSPVLPQNNISSGWESFKKRALVEVFAVRIISSLEKIDRIHGFILLRGSDQNYVLYEDPCGERGPQYNSEGYFTLIGPERGVEVKDTLVIYPWLVRHCFDRRTKGKKLWKGDSHRLPRTDQVIRKGVMCHVGLMQVDFAVYNDGVEARIEITILDLNLEGESLEICGTVKASNSVVLHTGARSTFFDYITSDKCLKLSFSPAGKAEIAVPLTRSVAVIPRESTLIVDVNLSLCCTPQGEYLAVGSVMFDARSRSSSTVEEKIIPGSRAKEIGGPMLRERLIKDEISEQLLDEMPTKFLTQVNDGTWQTGCWPQMYMDYSLSMLALNLYTQDTARRLADRPDNHRAYINCFCPSYVKTQMTNWEGNTSADRG